MLIAHLSDLHFAEGRLLHGRVDSAEALRAAVVRVNQLQPQPELVVISGDLVDVPDAPTYQALRDVLRGLAMPYLLLPGNHDDRAMICQAFPAQGFPKDARLCRRFDSAVGVVLTLDTTIPGSAGGEMADAHLSWLYEVTRARQPALLFMHHPPFACGIAPLDTIGLANADRLVSWLRHKPQIRGVFAGHVHRPIFTICGGVLACTAPALVHQFGLNLRAREPLSYTLDQPGFLLIDWNGEAPTVHVVPLSVPAEIVPSATEPLQPGFP
jgi:3',5'-cyclic-AMP phosphodiesterase